MVCWGLLNNPQDKFLVVSASKSRADDFSIFTQRLIYEMPILQHLMPRRDQRQSKLAFDVAPALAAHAPSVKSVGVFGQMTGSRANKIIADDVESAMNSMTQDRREKLINTVMEFEDILSPGGEIIYLGTPQSEESIYNKLRSKGYHCRIWSARVPDPATVEGYQGALAPMLQKQIDDGVPIGTPTDPKRFDEVELSKRESAKGRSGFALQFMLDTRLSDALRYPLKCSDIIVQAVGDQKASASIQYGSGSDQLITELRNPGFSGDRWYEPMYWDKENFRDYELKAMVIDPSGRGKDETAYSIGMLLNGNIEPT
ncbi:MAG: phage terminase large subunit [Deltaproteobacteria bacterium]|nr:phage terminase large subunit [Deltaproteobacteria bacterium]